MEEEALLKKTDEKGGLKAVVFIIGTDALDKMASQGLMANMILYLTEQYHMEMATASNVLFFWSSACSFTPVIGAIIADSYLGRFHTIGFGSLIYLLKLGWGIGFAVPCVLMLLGVISFFLASHSYVKFKSETNLITGLIQVVVAAYRNRNLRVSDNDDMWSYHCKTGSRLVTPTRNLRFLNKACIVIDHEKDLSRDCKVTNPWSLCSVDQVERLKALIKVIPIWSTGMIMSVNISQKSFPTLQAASMDRRIFAGLTIPAASFGTFTIVFIIIWICLYDRVFLPLASKAMRRPLRLSSITRMGIGIFLSTLAVTATAIAESFRRGEVPVPMSAMWLLPQHCLSGFSEGSNMVGQIEFYFSELPRSMLSIASTLSEMGLSLASLLASLIMNIVDNVSRVGGHQTWISTDIDKGRYDYYYLTLAGFSVANIMNFILCSKRYGSLKDERKLGEEDDHL